MSVMLSLTVSGGRGIPRSVARSGPVLVRGVGRYMELRDLAKRREEQKRERECKVFFEHPKGNPAHFTAPQPFRLHHDPEAEARKWRMMEEVRDI